MPSTPLQGQITFSDVKSLTTDKVGFIPPSDVSIGSLANVVRQFGQKAPTATNLAFSGFYSSTIGGYTILTKPETFQDYYASLNDGDIIITLRNNTLKKRLDNKYYVKITTQEIGDEELDQQAVLLNWDGTGGNTVTFTGQDAGTYLVTVTDLTTGGVIGVTTVVVEYNGVENTYYSNN